MICYGSEQTITSSDANNGKGIGNALLKRKATYTYLGWDFDEVWGIDEGTSYPYLRYFNPPESQSITFETPSLTYGDASFTLPATTEQGLTIKWTTSNENILTINGNILTIKGAGTCNLIATQLGDNTYKSIRETYPISIAKAPLIITADNYTRNVGEENPELTLTYSGFVNDEDETALKTPPIITTTATKDSPVGDYAITVSGAESDNYDITYKNGILTIIDETALRNTLAVNHTMLRPGKEATIDICLDNEDTMIAFEFYMQLPEGISITLDEDGYPDVTLNSTRANRHILEVADKGDGLYYFLCYSNSNAAIKGSNGELLSFNVDCDEEVAQGVYQGHIRSLKFSDSNENRIMLSNIDFDIEVSSVLKGDVNDDEDIDVIDVVTMVNYMIGRPSETFVFAAADHNDDGIVDVMDLVRQVSLVMSQSASSAPAINSFEKLDYGLSLVTDKEGLVNVSLADGIRYVATQFVVTLSKGQKLVGITTDDEHIVNILPLSDNRYFVMSYSMRNATFASNDRMLTLNVVGEGTVEVENVSLVDANEDKVVFQNVSTETTGINEVDVNLSSPMDIYSVNGSLLKKGVTTTENLRNGIYVINGKKVFVK